MGLFDFKNVKIFLNKKRINKIFKINVKIYNKKVDIHLRSVHNINVIHKTGSSSVYLNGFKVKKLLIGTKNTTLIFIRRNFYGRISRKI